VATGTGIMLEPFCNGVGVDSAFEIALSCLAFLWFENPEHALREMLGMLRVAKRVYVFEEEGIPARKRIEIPKTLEKFFETIGSLEKEVYIEELDAYRSGLIHGRVYETDIVGSHKFVCWEIR